MPEILRSESDSLESVNFSSAFSSDCDFCFRLETRLFFTNDITDASLSLSVNAKSLKLGKVNEWSMVECSFVRVPSQLFR